MMRLNNLIKLEKQSQMSVKEMMNSSKGSIRRSKPNVSESFQNLDYLSKVPKRVDCWLSRTDRISKNTSTPREHNNNGLNTHRSQVEKDQ
jgi:hypothetical protein